jgi:hypothetical protein
MDLSLADLAGALLHGASISNSVLTFAHLMGADLTDANLGHSDLRGVEVSASQIALVARMNGDLPEEPWATMEFRRRTRKPGDRSPKGALSLLQGTWQGKELGGRQGSWSFMISGNRFDAKGPEPEAYSGRLMDVLLASRFDVAADMNGNGAVNGLDVGPFVEIVDFGDTQQIPEPSDGSDRAA